MGVGERVSRCATGLMESPRRAAVAALVVLATALLAATQLHPSDPERLLARPGSAVGAATRGQERAFGGEPIVVLERGNPENLLAGDNLGRSLVLERRIARIAGVRTAFGPGSFVDQAVGQMGRVVQSELGPPAERADQVARKAVALARAAGVRDEVRLAQLDEAARLRALGPLRKQYESLLVRFGYIGMPSLSNRNFVFQLVMGAGLTPKKRFAWIFPDSGHGLVLVRLKEGLSDRRVRAIGGEIRRLVAGAHMRDVRTSIAGPPLVVAAATPAVGHELLRLAPIVLLAMALVLLLGVGIRPRSLAPLIPAGLAVALTTGLSWPLGLGFTPATLAALPVVLGLALDYAIQLQARYAGERTAGRPPRDAALTALSRVGPTLALAGGVMLVGFLLLTFSPVPLVGRLGLTLALGVASAWVSLVAFAVPLLVVLDRGGAEAPRLPAWRVPAVANPSLRLAALAVCLGVGIAGLVLSASTPVESDLRKIASPDMPALRSLESLQRELGTSGQLRVAVTAKDVTDPKVLAWMARVEPKILRIDPRLQPGPNLASLLASSGAGEVPSRPAVQRLLRLVPPAFISAVVTPDHRRAELSFGVPLGSAAAQARLIDRMRAVLADAPPGVHAQAAGLLAMSAAGVRGLQDERPWMLLLAALVICLLLYVVRGRLDRAIIPVAPALLAAGATAVIVKAVGLHLSPLSAALDPLVLAVGVEFGLLLEGRYREERVAGNPPDAAAAIATDRLLAPVVLSAGTVAVGFAILAAGRLPVLRQFGLVAAIELAACVAASVILVPALAAAADRRRTTVWDSRGLLRPTVHARPKESNLT